MFPVSNRVVVANGSNLRPVVVEDAHEADGHSLVDAAAEGLSGEGEDERHSLFPTCVDDGVEGLVQTTWGEPTSVC